MAITEDQTLSDWLAHHASATPDAPALIDAQGALSYGDLAAAVERLCSGLAGLGITKGDVVGVQLPNTRDFVVAFLAVAARGAVFLTLHMPYRSKELQGLLGDSGAGAVIVTNADTDSRLGDVQSVRAKLPALETIIVAGTAAPGCIALSELARTKASPGDQHKSTAQDRYLLLYTSGTTAAPKGVPHIYASFLNNAALSARELEIDNADRILSLAPFTHLYGLFTLHLSLAAGAASVLIPAFNPATLPDDLRTAKATHVFCAPAHFAPFAKQGALVPDLFEQTRLACLSGAAVPQTLAEAVDASMPDGKVIQLWGMSELQAGTFGRPGDPALKRHTTAGRAVPFTELRVLDEGGTPLPAGQEGALEMRGPSLFKGYLNRVAETQRAFDADGWFATGDLAVLDRDGYLSITGRTKELINRGGVKYNPIEIEEILGALPAIAQCAIVPVPDPDLGERGCLCVALAPGATLTLDEVTQTLAQTGLAKYKWPEKLALFDHLPMTPTRKVMRATLVQRLQTQKETS